MKTSIIIVCLSVLFFQSCKDSKKQDSTKEATVEQIALNFDTEEIYKELIRRSSKISDSVSEISVNSNSTIRDFDTLRNQIDTIIKPSESDTILLTSIKAKFKKYSDEALFNAYNKILEKRAENKGAFVRYGEDNRNEVSNSLSLNYVSSSKCVFALIEKKYLSRNGNISKGKYSTLYKLCSDEKYSNQDIFAECTGFAIASNKVVTAGHCFDQKSYGEFLLVSDFTVDKIESYMKFGIPETNIFEITNLLAKNREEKDYAVLVVNKTISQDRIVKLSSKLNVTSDDYFYVIGFPCGLSMKICNSASLRKNSNPDYFQINSDTYGGNSGSPVFNERTNEVEGILVRGNTDFRISVNNCYSSIQCPEFGCRGEDVTKVRLIKRYVQ
jgi:hypothetical protein